MTQVGLPIQTSRLNHKKFRNRVSLTIILLPYLEDTNNGFVLIILRLEVFVSFVGGEVFVSGYTEVFGTCLAKNIFIKFSRGHF